MSYYLYSGAWLCIVDMLTDWTFPSRSRIVRSNPILHPVPSGAVHVHCSPNAIVVGEVDAIEDGWLERPALFGGLRILGYTYTF